MSDPQTGDNDKPLRIVLAKLGLDGHDRGLKVVARMLRDGGLEVIYLGLRQTTEQVIAAVEQEDADAIGISMLNGGHLALSKKMIDALNDAEVEVPLIVGGIVPEGDVQKLDDLGVAAILGPGSSSEDCVKAVRDAVQALEAHS